MLSHRHRPSIPGRALWAPLSLAALCGLAGCGSEVIIGFDDPGDVSGEVRNPDTQPPIARCAIDPDVPAPLSGADLIGENSEDPDGIPLIDYRWRLVRKPATSDARLPEGDANLLGFVPDVGGAYGITLTVVNDRGRESDPCAIDVVATPAHDLYVELVWQYGSDNLDLVLTRGQLQPPNEAGLCAPGRCDVDWGAAGATDDDPEVLADDADDEGPEAIGVLAPASGTFFVSVYDNPNKRRMSDNEATVTVYLDGVAVWSGKKTITGEFAQPGDVRAFTPFAQIDVGAGTVEGL